MNYKISSCFSSFRPLVSELKNFNYLVPIISLQNYYFTPSGQKYNNCNQLTHTKEKLLTNYVSTSVYISRFYAKNKDKKKDKGKSKIAVNESQLGEIINVDSVKNQMVKAIEQLKTDFIKNVSVRSSAGAIESLPVTIDDKEHTLQELAQIVRKNPKLIVVNMAVFPQAIPSALKAIEKSGMNLNPQQDGTTLFIPVPIVTKEHRENLSKSAKMLFVKCKDSIRAIQTKQCKTLKNKSGISEDSTRNAEQQVIAIADSFIHEAEQILKSKQKELVG